MKQDTAPLWHAFKEQGCEQARAALIEIHRPYARLTVQRVAVASPRERAEDLESEALIALVRAVDRFDPSRGIRFVTYAVTMMRGAVREALRQDDWVPRSVRDQEKRGEAPVIVAQVSLDATLVEGGTLADCLPDAAAPFEHRCLEEAERERIRRLVRALPKTERCIIEGIYWHGQTAQEISQQLDRSPSRVHQLHALALGLLRAHIDRLGIDHAAL